MKRKMLVRCLVILLLVVCVASVVLIVLGPKMALGIHQKRFKEYDALGEEYFTSTVYREKLKLSAAEWEKLKAELMDEEWHSIDPKIEYVSSRLISEEEYQHATECLSKYTKVYYSLIPKACKERIVVMEYDDYVIIHLMIAVYSPWSKEQF